MPHATSCDVFYRLYGESTAEFERVIAQKTGFVYYNSFLANFELLLLSSIPKFF